MAAHGRTGEQHAAYRRKRNDAKKTSKGALARRDKRAKKAAALEEALKKAQAEVKEAAELAALEAEMQAKV